MKASEYHGVQAAERGSSMARIEIKSEITGTVWQLKAQPGDLITVESRRGKISLFAREDAGTPVGSVFIPFAFYEAAANILTNPVLDPFGKIPEFKYCAVKVTKGGASPVDPGYGKGRSLSQLQS